MTENLRNDATEFTKAANAKLLEELPYATGT